jgi:hypothetical protein
MQSEKSFECDVIEMTPSCFNFSSLAPFTQAGSIYGGGGRRYCNFCSIVNPKDTQILIVPLYLLACLNGAKELCQALC